MLHEYQGINACIDGLFRHISPDLCEVIVVDGDEKGSTIREIVHPRVIRLCGPRGRGIQMNEGARHARGKYLVFLHADTVLPPDALSQMTGVLTHPKYVAGAFTLRFDSERFIFRLIGRAAALRYGLTRLPYGDQAFFMTRAYFHKIGGFAGIPIMEDLDLMRRIKQRGDRICIVPAAVTTSPRRWEGEGIVYSILRTWVLASLFCAGVPPHILVRYYRSWRVSAIK